MRTKTHSISVICSLVLTLLPTPVSAGGRLEVHDSIAGLELQAELTGFAGNTSLVVMIDTPTDSVSLPTRTDTSGDAYVSIPSALTQQAGDYTAFVKHNGNRITPDSAFVILPGRVSAADSLVEADTTSLRADGNSNATVTVTVTDQYGNALSGRPVELLSSRTGDRITPLTDETDELGMQQFTVTTTQAGTFTLRASDILSDQTLAHTLTLTAGAAGGTGGPKLVAQATTSTTTTTSTSTGDDDGVVSFEVTLTPASATVSDTLDLRVTAVRDDGSIAQGYTRQPSISAPTDADAVVPGFGTLIFRKAENGVKKCLQCVSFTVPGVQTLVVEDTLDDGTVIRGEATIDVATSPEYDALHKIQILSHRDGGKISTTDIVLEGIGPAFANLLITGGEADVRAETDDKGMFSVPLMLDPDSGEYTIRVRTIDQDDTGTGRSQYDSGNLRLVRDNSGPDISYQFDPSEPAATQDVQLTVQSEPDLKSVTLKIGEETKTLSEDSAKKGTYTVFFTAPDAGEYQLPIIAVDEAGNTTEVRASVRVQSPKLPAVQNVRAEPGPTGMRLTWDNVDNTAVTSYRVFVGTDDTVSKTTLQTNGLTTEANVMGLDSGTEYFFAVAGMIDDTEGDRSDVVSSPFGPILAVTPDSNKIDLDLAFLYPVPRNSDGTLDTPNDLQSYLVEFSVDEGVYTNQFDTDEAAAPGNDGLRRQRITLPDLLEDTTYFIRLTPRTLNGQLLQEHSQIFTATTLSSDGFRAQDDTGTSPFAGPPSNDLHTGAPTTTGSGLPLSMIVILAVVSGAIFFLRRRTNKKATEAFLRHMQSRYNS